jgi:hypothetical protein
MHAVDMRLTETVAAAKLAYGHEKTGGRILGALSPVDQPTKVGRGGRSERPFDVEIWPLAALETEGR